MKNHLNVVILAITAIIAVLLMTNTYKNRNRSNDLINVTGLGEKDFKSDLIVWSGAFISRSMELKEAYARLKENKDRIKKYLIDKGVKDKEILFSAVNISKEFDDTYDTNGNRSSVFIGYKLTQKVEIESKEVDKIENIAREVTDLINTGIEFYSDQPQYYYTKLSELKVEMVAAATKDARQRAEQIAENAGSDIGELRYAQMGIFQIIGQNSNEDYSWGGTFNTSSKMKTATITMKLQFGVE